MGKPYNENYKLLNQKLEFDYDIILSIREKNITVGDLIAHILPYSKFDVIIKNISILLNIEKLQKELKNFKEKIYLLP